MLTILSLNPKYIFLSFMVFKVMHFVSVYQLSFLLDVSELTSRKPFIN